MRFRKPNEVRDHPWYLGREESAVSVLLRYNPFVLLPP